MPYYKIEEDVTSEVTRRETWTIEADTPEKALEGFNNGKAQCIAIRDLKSNLIEQANRQVSEMPDFDGPVHDGKQGFPDGK